MIIPLVHAPRLYLTGTGSKSVSEDQVPAAFLNGRVPPRHEGSRHHREHRLAALVGSAVAGFQDSPFGPALGGDAQHDLAGKTDRVAGEHRPDPAQFAKSGRWPPHRDLFAARCDFSGLTLAVGHQQFHADRPDMPPGGGQTAEQRVAPLLLIEMKPLRVEFRREYLDGVGGEGERTEFAPVSDLDILEEMHQLACIVAVSSRRRTMIGDTISHSAWPAALLATALSMTRPVVGRL